MNLIVTIVSVIVFFIFAPRAAKDFGYKFIFKLPIPFAEISKNEKQISSGGRGGDAKVSGESSIAIGGKGGGGGPGGKGGDGGSAESVGDNTFAMGGEGGEAGQTNRGGRGGRSPLEILGYPNTKLPDGTYLWDKGRGGNGANPIASVSNNYNQNRVNWWQKLWNYFFK